MTDIASLYPGSPAGIPANLARPSIHYRLLVVFVLLTLFLFLLIYLVLVAGSVYLLIWPFFPPAAMTSWLGQSLGGTIAFLIFRVGVFVVGALFFAFLFKAFLPRRDDTLLLVEIKEQEQGPLFQFIRCVCREIGSTMPARVYLNHEVNAAVTFPTSVVNLVVPPRKDLLIGLGLVNALNLVEFKAILAHEFGHFSQRSLRLSGYANLVHRIVHNMVYARDRWDGWLIQACDLPVLSAFAVPLAAVVEFLRTCLDHLFRVLSRAHLSLRRQMELNADLVAVTAAGSDAPVHALLRSDVYHRALVQAQEDLALATEQAWFTKDLFYHQERALDYLRTIDKDASLGQPPSLPADPAVQVQVFPPDAAMAAAAMWTDHPAHHDRERNAKRRYFRSPQDDRSAWLLFHDPHLLREQVTGEFYRVCLNVEPEEARPPESVQAFIDEEHATLAVPPRYHGIYDDRLLELEDLETMIEAARCQAPRAMQEIATAVQELYPHEPPSWPAEHRRRRQDIRLLDNLIYGESKPAAKDFDFRGQRVDIGEAPDLLKMVQGEMAADRQREAEFDRNVFLLYHQLAAERGRELEFCQRYQFHRDLQKLLQQACEQKARLDSVLRFLSGRRDLHIQELREVQQALCEARQTLAQVLTDAGNLRLPALKQVPAGEPLSRLLPAEPGVPELDMSALSVDASWLGALNAQLSKVVDKLNRLFLKSLNGVLAFQDKLAVCVHEGSTSRHAPADMEATSGTQQPAGRD
jgi:Zn-dependent protease with chaperone function